MIIVTAVLLLGDFYILSALPLGSDYGVLYLEVRTVFMNKKAANTLISSNTDPPGKQDLTAMATEYDVTYSGHI